MNVLNWLLEDIKYSSVILNPEEIFSYNKEASKY